MHPRIVLNGADQVLEDTSMRAADLLYADAIGWALRREQKISCITQHVSNTERIG